MNDAQVIVAAVAFRRSPAGRRRFQSRVRVGPAVRRSVWLSPPRPGPTRHCHSKIPASCTGPGPGRHWLRRRALGTPSPLCRRRAVETLRRLAWENGKCRWIASPCAMPSMACVPIRQNPKLPSFPSSAWRDGSLTEQPLDSTIAVKPDSAPASVLHRLVGVCWRVGSADFDARPGLLAALCPLSRQPAHCILGQSAPDEAAHPCLAWRPCWNASIASPTMGQVCAIWPD